MDAGRCGWCDRSLILSRAGAKYCSPKCRVYANRTAKRLPVEMTGRDRWVRAVGKRPVMVDGAAASSTDSSTWATCDGVRRSRAGDGFGFMLGDGIGCYDLDDVSDEEARELIALITEPVVFVERSLSGRGVHVFVEADECRGSRKWQGRHERYTRERFIRMTGNRL